MRTTLTEKMGCIVTVICGVISLVTTAGFVWLAVLAIKALLKYLGS
ncbi:MAG TPA: hypothetical protein VM537_29280 [Anaerolineae bacterium]|nr:hypothetical protein [Phycisphaerae bacterium]HUW13852.1 hypothetical protein [Anaerolineae bacterium]